MRSTLAPPLVGIFPPTGSLLRRMVDHLLEADARHRDACRLKDRPSERLRGMGLTRPTNAKPIHHREPWE